MAEAPKGGASRQEQANESRLRVARREPPGEAQPGPSAGDKAAAWTKEQRTSRPSDEAARQNIERRQGITQRAGVQIDRKRIEYTPETRVGNMTISSGKQVTEREEMGAGAKDRGVGAVMRQQRLESQLNRGRRQGQSGGKGGGGGGMSAKEAMSLAKATPATAAAMIAAQAATGQLSKADIQRGMGRGCVLSLWNSMWLTFGHNIYPLMIIFWMAWASKFARQYVPEVGEEWFPAPLLKKIPKPLLIPIKLGEIVAMSFILFWVFMLDMLCIGFLAFLLAIILSAVDFASSINPF